jgi:uncharacterized protein (DUF427 family)
MCSPIQRVGSDASSGGAGMADAARALTLARTANDQGGTVSTASEPLIPGPDHPIDITRFNGRVRVMFGNHSIVDTTSALELREASYPPAYYVPLAEVDHEALRPSDTTSRCPYKGLASYYDVIDPHTLQSIDDAVWHYREPYPSVSQIADYVAFYPNKVNIEVETAG